MSPSSPDDRNEPIEDLRIMPYPVPMPRILAAAEQLGVTLPETYMSRVLQDNGSEIYPSLSEQEVWWLYPVFDDSEPDRAERTKDHLVLETEKARSLPGFPEHGVAIGHDGADNYLVFLPQDGSTTVLSDEVHVWNKTTHELTKVADEFIDLET
ncbi:MAG: SMI1/KNR4 family protein [Planctomycetes bacterium]|nr:SMI1/KNR4 family protein [Planctomycetota bacterium]